MWFGCASVASAAGASGFGCFGLGLRAVAWCACSDATVGVVGVAASDSFCGDVVFMVGDGRMLDAARVLELAAVPIALKDLLSCLAPGAR
jgi:hypothetical protein